MVTVFSSTLPNSQVISLVIHLYLHLGCAFRKSLRCNFIICLSLNTFCASQSYDGWHSCALLFPCAWACCLGIWLYLTTTWLFQLGTRCLFRAVCVQDLVQDRNCGQNCCRWTLRVWGGPWLYDMYPAVGKLTFNQKKLPGLLVPSPVTSKECMLPSAFETQTVIHAESGESSTIRLLLKLFHYIYSGSLSPVIHWLQLQLFSTFIPVGVCLSQIWNSSILYEIPGGIKASTITPHVFLMYLHETSFMYADLTHIFFIHSYFSWFNVFNDFYFSMLSMLFCRIMSLLLFVPVITLHILQLVHSTICTFCSIYHRSSP